jgi:hypothetical protein
MLYAAKCYWPEVTEGELAQAARRVARRPEAGYAGSLLFPGDELVLCLFDARSAEAVRRASERAGIPCERVMELRWLAPPGQERSTPWASGRHG